MAMYGYTKLFSSIVTSTVWQQDKETKIVWITMLALSDKDGYVAGSIPGLAHVAGVGIEECKQALENLEQPDPYSRTHDYEGRRIEPIDGGWLILNRAKYRDLIPEEHRRERARIRKQRQRERHGQDATMSRVTECDSHDLSHQKEKEKEKEEVKPISSKPSVFDLEREQIVLAVWDYYITTIGKNRKLYTLTDKRKRMGVARICDLWRRAADPKPESVTELMKLCVDGLASSTFHNGDNQNGKKYLDWDILFRSTEQMEKWLSDEGNRKPRARVNGEAKSTMEAAW
jgi:hypothetical protein